MLLESLSFSEVAAYLKDLCQKQYTGTFFIIEEGHFLGQIGLKDGEIVSLPAKFGSDNNLFSVLSSKGGGGNTFSVSFTDGAIPSTHMDLPPTAEILASLDGLDSATTSPQHSPQPSTLTDDDKAVLEQTLCEYIGPIATMICADCFPAATTLANAIDTLADEIPNPQAAIQFRDKVRQRLAD